MTGRFGRYPTPAQVVELSAEAAPAQQPRLEALTAIAAVERTIAASAARRACLMMGRADVRPCLGTGRLDADQLATMPFGLIGLDGHDRVRLYNRWEAAFSRQAPDAVIGRHWFREVALCTRVDTFEDRYRSFAAQPAPDATEPFDFTFEFPHGRQHVAIVFLRGTAVGLNLIAVVRSSAGFRRDTRILLRLLSLAMASGDHERFEQQIKAWYLDYLSSIGVQPREIYLLMGQLGDTLPRHLQGPVVGALRGPLRRAMGIVEDAMLTAIDTDIDTTDANETPGIDAADGPPATAPETSP